mmetsp:Transcript_23875/g.35268  ORF Transcript_23875/g.35268 Transcript_23875/m.35268 type:complete len:134 (-) Transcript_23875:1230-1631(-)
MQHLFKYKSRNTPINCKRYIAIHIHKVVFQQIKEEKLYNEIRQLYAKYKQQTSRRKELDCLSHFKALIQKAKSMKLSTLRSSKGKKSDQDQGILDTRNKLKELLKKIHHLMTMFQKQEQEIQDSESLLQEMWE